MVSDTFTERVERDLKALAAQESQLDAEEQNLAARAEEIKRARADIRAQSTEINRLITMYQRYMADDGQRESTHVAGLFPDVPAVGRTNGSTPPLGTTADMSAAIIAAHGGKMKIRDLLNELIRAGKMKDDGNSYGSLFGTLKRNESRFTWIGPGEFALVEVKTSDSAKGTDSATVTKSI